VSEGWGDHLLTCGPFQVFTLPQDGGEAGHSIPLSRAYNKEHYYGWVGPNCSKEWAVVLNPPDGQEAGHHESAGHVETNGPKAMEK